MAWSTTEKGEVIEIVRAALGELVEMVDFHIERMRAAGHAAAKGIANHDGSTHGSGMVRSISGGASAAFASTRVAACHDDAVAEAPFEY